MFYDNLVKICNARGISPSAAIAEAGINKSAGTRWKNGKKPTAANLQKLADYFGISKEELLGEGLTKREVITGDREARPAEGDELLNAIRGLTDEERQKVSDYIELLEAARRRQ